MKPGNSALKLLLCTLLLILCYVRLEEWLKNSSVRAWESVARGFVSSEAYRYSITRYRWVSSSL